MPTFQEMLDQFKSIGEFAQKSTLQWFLNEIKETAKAVWGSDESGTKEDKVDHGPADDLARGPHRSRPAAPGVRYRRRLLWRYFAALAQTGRLTLTRRRQPTSAGVPPVIRTSSANEVGNTVCE